MTPFSHHSSDHPQFTQGENESLGLWGRWFLVTLVFHLTTPEFLPPLKSTCAVDKPSTLDRQLNPWYSFNMGVAQKISKQNIAGTYHIPSFQSVYPRVYGLHPYFMLVM